MLLVLPAKACTFYRALLFGARVFVRVYDQIRERTPSPDGSTVQGAEDSSHTADKGSIAVARTRADGGEDGEENAALTLVDNDLYVEH